MKLYTDSSLKLNEGCVCSIANSRRSQVIYIRTENKNSTQAEYEGILRALVVKGSHDSKSALDSLSLLVWAA